jgi:HAD superfamily hydrolase (TIGR01509 family)
MIKVVAFGAIGSIAETSDLQREAFNLAFADARLGWEWDQATYRNLLGINGGQNRIRAFAADRGGLSDDTVIALHMSKTAHFEAIMATRVIEPRAGVVALLTQCRARGVKTALCTSTSQANVDAIARAVSPFLDFAIFDVIVTRDKIAAVKPAPDAYHYLLAQLGVCAADVVAIEDTPVSIAAAKAAGIFTLATPGATTADQDFSAADRIVARLDMMTFDDVTNRSKP